MFHTKWIASLLTFASITMAAFGYSYPLQASSNIGDRLVSSVNSQPFTQRDVETYFFVKEIIRAGEDGAIAILDSKVWTQALDSFNEDMIILIESTKLGSFEIPREVVEKYFNLVESRLRRDARLKQVAERLAIRPPLLIETTADVLRVAAFRESKSRQAAVASKTHGPSLRPTWLQSLHDRAVVRLFENAESYVLIQPGLASAAKTL